MTTNYSDLIARLRDLANQIDPCLVGGPDARLLLEAASALESLQAERDRLREAMADIEKRCSEYERINLVGKTQDAKKSGTIRNCLLIARAALSQEDAPNA